MPYINKELKEKIDGQLNNLIDNLHDETLPHEIDGVLNYVISRLVGNLLRTDSGWSYSRIARAIAVFECAKLEFYERIARPYEDLKIEKNGDLPEYSGKIVGD